MATILKVCLSCSAIKLVPDIAVLCESCGLELKTIFGVRALGDELREIRVQEGVS